MRTRITKVLAGLAVVSALAVGGAGIAGAAGNPPPATPPPAVGVQQGDQTAPDVGGTSESAPESASAESATAESASSESGAPSDGPGGHADDPANATLDYQFQGEQ